MMSYIKERFAVEIMNAWLDGFENSIISYETKVKSWTASYHLAFTVIIMRAKHRNL